MINRTHRFKGHNSVQRVRSRASRGPGFSVYAQQSRRPWRAAVVVSKKVHKAAVVRNRIRRRFYEVLRLYDKETQLPNVDLVCIIHDASLADIDYDTLENSLRKCLEYALQQSTPSRSDSRQ